MGGTQVFCYALSPSDGSECRARIEAEVEHFADVFPWPSPTLPPASPLTASRCRPPQAPPPPPSLRTSCPPTVPHAPLQNRG